VPLVGRGVLDQFGEGGKWESLAIGRAVADGAARDQGTLVRGRAWSVVAAGTGHWGNMMRRGQRWCHGHCFDIVQVARIEGVEGVVADGAVQVHIPGSVGEGIKARPAAEGGGIVAETEVIQAAGRVEPAALVQVEPSISASRPHRPTDRQDTDLAERVVDVPLDHIARVVKDCRDIIIRILAHPQVRHKW